MRRRLYFMLPDISTARRVLDDSCPPRHIAAGSAGSQRATKTDIVHGAEIGLVIAEIEAGGIEPTLAFP